MRIPRPPRLHGPRRGAATLIVVMLLFFVVSLAAAYASRNLIFEQRTSANQLRSTQVLEAADAGIEWATAMLNSGRIDGACAPTADAAQNSFRERYLVTNAGTGNVTIVPNATAPAQNLWAACVFDGANWSCACPTGTLAAGDLPNGPAAFAVRFVAQAGTSGARPGVVRIESNGCTSNDLACLRYAEPTVPPARCRSGACAVLGLYGGIRTTPSAALTARQAVNGNGLQVVNQDLSVGAITVHSGGAVAAGIGVTTVAGTPSASSIRQNDNTAFGWLGADAADCTQCLFASVFGVRPQTYRRLMGTLAIDCTAGCTAADVNDALGNSRGRVVYLFGAGGLSITDAADSIGSAASPVVLIVEGPLAMTAGAAGATLRGAVYAGSVTIDGGTVTGALISATTVTATGGTVVYDGATLKQLRVTTGSYVRIPGSWRDHP